MASNTRLAIGSFTYPPLLLCISPTVRQCPPHVIMQIGLPNRESIAQRTAVSVQRIEQIVFRIAGEEHIEVSPPAPDSRHKLRIISDLMAY